MQGAAISDWQEGGSFSAPFDGALESVELSAPEFILYGDPEGN